MTGSLSEKIEAIRREPEHIRVRYVVLCVSVSMVFIVGIWLLSIEDSVSTVARDIPQAVEQGKNIAPGAPSLSDLFEQAAPLRVGVEEKKIEGSEFFEQQLGGQKGNAVSEGVTLP